MNKAIVPISGGLDSSVILKQVCHCYDEVYALSFNYGQRHSKELDCACRQVSKYSNIKQHKILDITFFKDIVTSSSLTNNDIDVAKTKDVLGDAQTVNYVPFRNMMMLSIACAYAESVGARSVYHGSALVDSQAGYWDGSKEFLDSINNLASLNRKQKIKIHAPLLHLSKKEIIKNGIDNGVDFSSTWTCYEGKEEACGYCTACSSRIQGFLQNNYVDPIKYSRKDIPWE